MAKPLYTTIFTKAKTIAKLSGDGFARTVVKDFNQNNRITGLTNGKFSLISLVSAVLEKTGPSNVIISTWSSGLYDANVMHDLLSSNQIQSFRFILDRSFKTRLPQYATRVTDLFSPENIRTTNVHSKFVLIWNENWNVCIRSSMNLNENKRTENFDIDNDIEIFNLFKNFSNELFDKQQPGIIESRDIVDPIFDNLFQTDSNTDSYSEIDYNSIEI